MAYVGAVSVGLAVLVFVVELLVNLLRKQDVALQDLLARAAGAGGFPLAIAVIYGAFDPAVLTQTPGLNIPIAFGGLSLLMSRFRPS